MSRNVYTVEYKLHSAGEVKFVDVIASNKAEAYDEAYWIAIPNKEHEYAYSAWTASVTYRFLHLASTVNKSRTITARSL